MESIEIVMEIINRALDGELSLLELYELWPEELAKDKLFETIYNDIESVVEHYPGTFESYFKESRDYKILLVDKQLVNIIIHDKPDGCDLLEIRNKLLE